MTLVSFPDLENICPKIKKFLRLSLIRLNFLKNNEPIELKKY